jgi:MATE family multidrug resistance protein
MGPEGFWIGLLSGLTAAALMLTVRLRFRLRLFAVVATR